MNPVADNHPFGSQPPSMDLIEEMLQQNWEGKDLSNTHATLDEEMAREFMMEQENIDFNTIQPRIGRLKEMESPSARGDLRAGLLDGSLQLSSILTSPAMSTPTKLQETEAVSPFQKRVENTSLYQLDPFKNHPFSGEAISPLSADTRDLKRPRKLGDFVSEMLSQEGTSASTKVKLPHVENGMDTFQEEDLLRAKRLKKGSQKNYQERPLTGFYKMAVTSNGEKLYFPFSRFKKLLDHRVKNLSSVSKKDDLLNISIYKLMDQIETEKAQLEVDSSMDQYRERMAQLDIGYHVPCTDQKGNAALWADKYRPQSYMDLLTDEYLNRAVLQWVKQWDQCVFGKREPNKPKKPVFQHSNSKFTSKQVDRHGRPEKKILMLTGPPGLGKTTLVNIIAKQAGYNVIEVNASDERTADVVQSKILNAIEMKPVFGDCKPNLILIDEIDGALGGSGDNNFIMMLVKLATAGDKPTGNGTTSGEGEERDSLQNGRRKKKAVDRSLLRPIICVCNDLYAPALRPLRQIAQVYHVRKATTSDISKRLHFICEKEGIRADTRTLSILCEKTEGDIRTCLNILQFLYKKLKLDAKKALACQDAATPKWKRNAKISLSSEMVKNYPVGQKDIQKSVFAVWPEIFHIANQKRLEAAKFTNSEIRAGPSGGDQSFSLILPMIAMTADVELLMQGCFEMYPRMRFRDEGGYGQTIVSVLEYTCAFDALLTGMYGGGSSFGEAPTYLPYMLLAFHRFCAQASKPVDLEFPRQEIDFRQQLKQNLNILKGSFDHMSGTLHRCIGSATALCHDYLSPLLRIISPVFRSVNPQLMKPKEYQQLARVAEVMHAFGLTFRQDKVDSMHYVFVLEPYVLVCFLLVLLIFYLRKKPRLLMGCLSIYSTLFKSPLDRLIEFSSLLQSKSVLSGNAGVRQMLAHEVELAEMRREEERARERDALRLGEKAVLERESVKRNAPEGAARQDNPNGDSSSGMKDKGKMDKVKRDVDLTNLMAAGKERLLKKQVKRNCMNMFVTRHVALPETEVKKSMQPISYKFHEGSSNAVRRTLLMVDVCAHVITE